MAKKSFKVKPVDADAKRKSISDLADKMIEAAQLQITNHFEKELQRTLDDWGKRYPRHTFTAYQGHGMLSVEISPKIGKNSDITYLGGHYLRGAIKVLMEEVDSLVDWHCSLEGKWAVFESNKPFVSKKA